MKITDILLEFRVPEELKGVKVANVAGMDITVGDVQKVLPFDADPRDIVKYGTKINNMLQTRPIDGVDYTVGNALVDVATALPLGRALKGAKTALDVGKALGANELRRRAGHWAADQVEIMPTIGGGGSNESNSSTADTNKKKARYNVGDTIPVTVSGKKYSLKITNVLSNGYEVDASKVSGSKPGQTMTVPEPT
jgi:hypothetical protein